MNTTENTVTQIMDVAQSLMMKGGYNAFSYADVAEAVGIRKASIHYYFPSKSDLGRDVMLRYRVQAAEAVATIDRETGEHGKKLEKYLALFDHVMDQEGEICLVCILAADLPALPEPVTGEVREYYREQESWIAGVLEEGVKSGVFKPLASYEIEAQYILATIQGAMLMCRTNCNRERFRAITRSLMKSLSN